MSERRGDRAVSILLSVLIHAAIVGALVWGWFMYRNPPAAPQMLAIDATVVSNAPPSPPAPPAPPTPAPPTPPPPDTQAQDQQRADQARAEQAAKDQAEAQKKQQEQAEAQRADEQRQHEQEQQAEADRQAKLEAQATAKAEADAKAKVEADRKAQELAQQKQQAEQHQREQSEAELRAQLAAEEHANAVQASPARAEYLALIQAKIDHAWVRPASARQGIQCKVHITQVPGGEITNVTVQGCNGDESVRESVETAAYKASPLPTPADPALFDANIDVTFAPDD